MIEVIPEAMPNLTLVRPANPIDVATLPSVNTHNGLGKRACFAGIGTFSAVNMFGYGVSNLDPDTYGLDRIRFGLSFELAASCIVMSTVLLRGLWRNSKSHAEYNDRVRAFEKEFGIPQESALGSFDIFDTVGEDGKKERHLYYTEPTIDSDEEQRKVKIEDVAFILKKVASNSGCTHVVLDSDMVDDREPSMTLTRYVKERVGLKGWESSEIDQKLHILPIEEVEERTRKEQAKIVEKLIERIEDLDPNSKVVEFMKSLDLKTGDDTNKAIAFLRLRIADKINEVYRNKPIDSSGNPTTVRKIYTNATVSSDGQRVNLQHNGSLYDTTTNIASLLGIDEQTIYDILNQTGEYASGKQLVGLELILLRALGRDFETDVVLETKHLEGALPENSISKDIDDSSRLMLGAFRRSPGWRNRLAGLVTILLPVLLAGTVEYAQETHYLNAKDKLAEEYNVDPDKVLYENANDAARENPLYRQYDNVANWVYNAYASMDDYFKGQPDSSIPVKTGVEREIDRGSAIAQLLNSYIGNVYPGVNSAPQYMLEVTGDDDPNGFWVVNVNDTLEFIQSSPNWTSESLKYAITASDLTDAGPLPKVPTDKYTNYIKVTPSLEIPGDIYYTNDPELVQIYREYYSVSKTGDEVLPVGDDLGLRILRLPVKYGYKIVAASDAQNPSVVFRTERTISGENVLVIPDNYSQENLVYFVAKDDSGILPHANGETILFSQPEQYKTYEDVRNEALDAWRRYSPDSLVGDSAEEIQRNMLEYISSGEYSLTPISAADAEDGVDIPEILEATLNGSDRQAVCNTANTVLALSSPVTLHTVTGFSNSDNSNAKDGSGSLVMSSSEAHMETVDEEGILHDATPSLKDDRYSDFFTENTGDKGNGKDDPYENEGRKILTVALGGFTLALARKRLSSAAKSIMRFHRLRMARAYAESGSLAQTYIEENHRLFSANPDGPVIYGKTPDADTMREFITNTATLRSSEEAIRQANIYKKI